MEKKSNPQRGQSLVEYVALTALVAIVSIGAVKIFGSKVQRRLSQITNTFDRNIQQGLKAPRNLGEDEGGISLPGGFPFPKIPGIKLPRGVSRVADDQEE